MDLTEFANLAEDRGSKAADDPTTYDNVLKDVMVLDPDGELIHVKDLTFDPENDCWIISLEN